MAASGLLFERRNPDGGFGPIPGAVSEPEPTALVAAATSDEQASDWIRGAVEQDGSIGIRAAGVFRDLTALGVFALRAPGDIATAMRHVLGARGVAEPATEAIPHDPSTLGWSWTAGTFAWVEPTAWAVMAIRVFAPDAESDLADGIAVLRDRSCVGGGWNYGNRIVLGETLPPFVQTTALGVMALAGTAEPVFATGLAWLEANWRVEAGGLLSLALATAALRVTGSASAAEAAATLATSTERSAAHADTVALAWALLAASDHLTEVFAA